MSAAIEKAMASASISDAASGSGSSPAVAAAKAPSTSGAASGSGSSPGAPAATQKEKVDQQIAKAQGYKDAGNDHFSKGEVQEALKQWHLCLLHSAGINSFATSWGSTSSEEQNRKARELVISVHNNLCAAYIKQSSWAKVLPSASKVLELSPQNEPNVKALYRRALAYFEMGELQKAAQDLDVAMDVASQDGAVRQLAKKVANAADKKRKVADSQMKGFLGNGGAGQASSSRSQPKAKPKAAAA